jgi:hypothetical protein
MKASPIAPAVNAFNSSCPIPSDLPVGSPERELNGAVRAGLLYLGFQFERKFEAFSPPCRGAGIDICTAGRFVITLYFVALSLHFAMLLSCFILVPVVGNDVTIMRDGALD